MEVSSTDCLLDLSRIYIVLYIALVCVSLQSFSDTDSFPG